MDLDINKDQNVNKYHNLNKEHYDHQNNKLNNVNIVDNSDKI